MKGRHLIKFVFHVLLITLLFYSCNSGRNTVQILYYGHSCFELKYGMYRILIDPFTPEWFDYTLPKGKFDLVLSSHNAKDHSYFEGLNINKLCRASGATDEFEITTKDTLWIQKDKVTELIGRKKFLYWTVPTFHDEVQGKHNGVNGIICLDFNGIRIIHMGDIGHILNDEQIKNIGVVDILMIPVDSYYILELEKAWQIVNQLSPTIVIPMHYKTIKSHNNAYEEDLVIFSKMFKNVKEYNSSMFKVTNDELNIDSHLLILDYLTNK